MSRVVFESPSGWRKRLETDPLLGTDSRPSHCVIEWVGRQGRRNPWKRDTAYYWGTFGNRRRSKFVLGEVVRDGCPFRVIVERMRKRGRV